MLGWRTEARRAGGKQKIEEVSSTTNSYIHGTSFFGLATACNAIQQTYGAADHNSCICNSLSIPKVKEKLVTSLC
jgi:hypothetical protein